MIKGNYIDSYIAHKYEEIERSFKLSEDYAKKGQFVKCREQINKTILKLKDFKCNISYTE